jgi:hypothetical protein
MSHTHASPSRDIEPSKITTLVGNGNETDIIGEEVDIIRGWYSDGDLELYGELSSQGQVVALQVGEEEVPFEGGSKVHITARSPLRHRQRLASCQARSHGRRSFAEVNVR